MSDEIFTTRTTNLEHEYIKNTNTSSVKHKKIINRFLKYIYPEKSKEQ